MEVVIELPKDIDKLCRTCMNIVEENHKSCVTNSNSGQGLELNKMLLNLVGGNISPDECLPKFMCNECVEKLEIAYLFKQQCQNTYLNFQDFMYPTEKFETKTECFKFNCSTCEQCFSTQYNLSKHEIIHYKEIHMLSKHKYTDVSNTKISIMDNTEEILSLISQRKEEIKEGTNQSNNKEKKVNKIISPEAVQYPKTVKRQNKLHSCDLCEREFDTNLSLHLHFVNHAILAEGDTDPDIFNQYFLCRVCGETFTAREDLENHEIKCGSEYNEFKCGKCNQVFNSELNLLKHEKEFVHSSYLWEKLKFQITEKALYICPICHDEFTVKADLNLHSVRHVIKKITCRICKKTFSCEIAHNNHLKSHPNYKHMCELCGRWLGSRHALKTHIMGVHSVNKNFVCSVCSKAFKTPSRLYIHKLTHKEDKKFICSICSYKTNYVGDFRVHNRIHTAERPYTCNFVNCKRQFKTSSHLNEHIQRHLQIKKYRCNLCCMVFGHNHTLKMHLMVHTGEKPFSCNICKVKFRRKHHLKNHMKQHK